MTIRTMFSKRIYRSMPPKYYRISSKRQRTYFVGDIGGLQVSDVDRTTYVEKHRILMSRSMASYMRNSVRCLSSTFDHPVSPHYVFSTLNHYPVSPIFKHVRFTTTLDQLIRVDAMVTVQSIDVNARKKIGDAVPDITVVTG